MIQHDADFSPAASRSRLTEHLKRLDWSYTDLAIYLTSVGSRTTRSRVERWLADPDVRRDATPCPAWPSDVVDFRDPLGRQSLLRADRATNVQMQALSRLFSERRRGSGIYDNTLTPSVLKKEDGRRLAALVRRGYIIRTNGQHSISAKGFEAVNEFRNKRGARDQ